MPRLPLSHQACRQAEECNLPQGPFYSSLSRFGMSRHRNNPPFPGCKSPVGLWHQPIRQTIPAEHSKTLSAQC
jgi:hypothetical protein